VNKMKKGQSAVETITVLGFIILFSLPLLILLASLNTEESAIMQARSSTQILADTVNSVYIQGPGSIKIISVGFPPKLTNISFDPGPDGTEIVFTLETDAGKVDIVANSIAPIDTTSNITGDSGLNQGLQKVKIEYEYGTNKIKLTAVQ